MLTALEIRGMLAALLVSALTLGAVFGLSPLWAKHIAAQPVSSPPANAPIGDHAVLVAIGRDFFLQSCSHCHGNDATGGGEEDAPDLHHLAISDARMANTIRKGVKDEMPSFAKKYRDPEITAIVGYLKSLQ